MKRFVLADGNNFFVSCERVFNPQLLHKPVVVLSSNDGCVIARSNEAKQLGIKMGEPYFSCKALLKLHDVQVYSSNFALYSDMSERMMQALTRYASEIEYYSVDEAFLHFPEIATFSSPEAEKGFYEAYAHMVRQQVKQWVGIPLSIGLGPTKTLAKIANHIAKKNGNYAGVFDITHAPDMDALLETVAVGDIWGIGRRYVKLLQRYGITNAYQLTQCSDDWIRKHMSILGLKTVHELRGIACFNLQEEHEAKKSITASRSFGKHVTELYELKEAVAVHITRAAASLRAQDMLAQHITVFVSFRERVEYNRLYDAYSIKLPQATAYTPDLIAYAHTAVEVLFKKNMIYKKVGVVLDDFYSSQHQQLSAFEPHAQKAKQMHMMKTLDAINARMGKNATFFAAAGVKRLWQAKTEKKSPAYTTNWSELLTIKI